MVMPSVDILHSALRKAKRVLPTKGTCWGQCVFLHHGHIGFYMTFLNRWNLVPKTCCKLDIYFVYFVGIANIAKRERNRGAKQLDALMKVCSWLHICHDILWNKLVVLEFLCMKLFKTDIITSRFHLQELAISLRMYLENFPKKKYLHPYERSLIELTLGDGNYEEVNSYWLIVNVLYMHSMVLMQLLKGSTCSNSRFIKIAVIYMMTTKLG
jgi:nucleolar GTP-binding protein